MTSRERVLRTFRFEKTDRVPFEGDTPFVIGVKHKSEQADDPRIYNPRIDEDLSRLILKCLEKDVE